MLKEDTISVSARYLIIIVLGGILFFPLLGQVHLFDWDEINFAECAREMIVSKDYLRAQIDFMPFWEKPPLFIWMQVLSMKLFGINEYAARFPNAFIGVLTLVTLYYAGKRIVNEKMARWWVLIYAASWLPHFYFKSGIIDPTFNFFIFLAFFQAWLIRISEKKTQHTVLAGLCLGLAVLTKGPVAILVAILTFLIYIIINRGLAGYKIKDLLVIAGCTFIPVALWFGADVLIYGWEYGKWFAIEFITYQVRLFRTEDADHGGPFYYHFIILLIGCFPASAFLFQYSRKRVLNDRNTRDFAQWMWIMFWVVLILFSIVKTKIVHYSSLCYFPLTFLAALQVYRLAKGELKIKGWVRGVLVFTGCIWAILLTALPIAGINKEKLVPYFDDPFAVGNLQANISWSYAECLIGITYLMGIIVAVVMFRKNFKRGMVLLCVVQIIIIQVMVTHITPKIEGYSQRAAIEYFQSFEWKDVYVCVLGYKSYAHLFYTKKQASTNPNYHVKGSSLQNEDWLLNGNVDKPTYFICKIQDAAKYKAMPQLESLGGKNGFVFFKRR